MAKAKKTKKKPKTKRKPVLSKEIRGLNVFLDYTLRAIDGKSDQLDQIFNEQADRLRSQIEKAKEKQ